jgi:uncharacterized OsmC-like protein
MNLALTETKTASASDVRSLASATTTPVFGRFIISARANHLVSDGRASLGAPGEAITAGELLLASLASCGIGLIQVRAAETRRQLHGASADVSFERDVDDPTRFKAIELVFRLHGLNREEAEDLVGYFAARCPIYNTLRRGGPIEITIAEPE